MDLSLLRVIVRTAFRGISIPFVPAASHDSRDVPEETSGPCILRPPIQPKHMVLN